MRDLPPSRDLLGLARRLLLGDIAPLVPPERRRDLHLAATAIAIALRESEAGDAWCRETREALGCFYALSALEGGEGGDPSLGDGEGEVGMRPWFPHLTPALCAPRGGEGDEALLARFAADLRRGAFETSESRESAARAILWRLTIAKLREGNPGFLAANGFERD